MKIKTVKMYPGEIWFRQPPDWKGESYPRQVIFVLSTEEAVVPWRTRIHCIPLTKNHPKTFILDTNDAWVGQWERLASIEDMC